MAGSMHLSRLRRWFLASPPIEFAITNLKELLVGALRQGPIPQHVAFVMDGNRRFARSHGIETVEGHNLGFEALARVGLSPLKPVDKQASILDRVELLLVDRTIKANGLL